MKITLEIPDNRADFLLELLRNLPFLKLRGQAAKAAPWTKRLTCYPRRPTRPGSTRPWPATSEANGKPTRCRPRYDAELAGTPTPGRTFSIGSTRKGDGPQDRALLKECLRTPTTGTGKPEPLYSLPSFFASA